MEATVTTFTDREQWGQALYAFLAEGQRRTGSDRTVRSYPRMLRHFFGTIGCPPDRVTSQEVFAWAYGTGLSGKPPSSVDRRPARMPQQLLPLPDPNERRSPKPVRRARTPEGRAVTAARPQPRRHPACPRGHSGHAHRTPRPRNHPDAGAHRAFVGRKC